MAVRIADIPASERPRERLRRVGIAGLSDAELIALVVRSGGRGRNALDVATGLLAEHGSLGRLFSARLEDLVAVASMGEAKAASLAAAFELGRRATLDGDATCRINRPEDLVRSVLPYASDRRREEVFVLVMNGASRLVRVERLTSGTAEQALLSIREALAVALRHDGVSFGIAHTHPSGEAKPSSEDVRVTAALAEAAKATGLRFVDHVIVAGRRWASLKELGFL